jgi:hypothetical protein
MSKLRQAIEDFIAEPIEFDREKLTQLQKDLKAKATMLYMVDHREDKREIYSQ